MTFKDDKAACCVVVNNVRVLAGVGPALLVLVCVRACTFDVHEKRDGVRVSV